MSKRPLSKRARREFRLTKEEMALLILAGEYYEGTYRFAEKYGFEPKNWPHRGVLIKMDDASQFKWSTWDKHQGWVRW